MRPLEHAIASTLLVPAAWLATGNLRGAFIAGLVQVFLDLDHVVEHLFKGEHPFSLKEFTAPYNSLNWDRMVFLLHSYEIALLFCLFTWISGKTILGWIALGYGVHLMLDEIGNRRSYFPVSISRLFYCLSWRLLQGFKTERLTTFRTEEYANNPAFIHLRSGRPFASDTPVIQPLPQTGCEP